MQTESDINTIEDGGWTVRVRPPKESSNPRSLLLIHGKTGNEMVMWIFTQKIPGNYWLFSPRAPIKLEPNAYSWLPEAEGLPALSDFQQPALELLSAYKSWTAKTGAPQTPPDVMGFSQGAAMAYALAAFYPDQVGRVLALAGFLPKVETMPGPYALLRGKRIYIAHGTRDETVPVEHAQFAARELQINGADVTYCESDTGHKLSADCLRGLAAFIDK